MSARRPRYLLVSDDPALLERMRSLCGDADVDEVADALEARRRVAGTWPDVVLVGGEHPGPEWLRTLPQRWEPVPAPPGGDWPAGVLAFSTSGSLPEGGAPRAEQSVGQGAPASG